MSLGRTIVARRARSRTNLRIVGGQIGPADVSRLRVLRPDTAPLEEKFTIMRSLHLAALALATLLYGTLAAGAADAQDAPAGGAAPAADTGRRMYVGFGLGPAISVQGGGALFKLEQSIGVHVMPVNQHPGLFVGGALGESFRSGGTRFQFGGRVGFDAQVFTNGDLSLLIAPMVTVGGTLYSYRYTDPFGGGTTRDTYGAFNLGFAGEVRLVLAQGRVTVWSRPLGFDIDIRDGSAAYYDFLFGANYNF